MISPGSASGSGSRLLAERDTDRMMDAHGYSSDAQKRGRDRQRAMSGQLAEISNNPPRRPKENHGSRLHSLSPPPPPGQEHRHSGSYWPDDGPHASGGDFHPDQTRPFLGYEPPPPVLSGFTRSSSPGRYPPPVHSRPSSHQQKSRPLSATSDSEHGYGPSRQSPIRGSEPSSRHRTREQIESDRRRRDAIGGGVGGARRLSGLNQVVNASAGEDEDASVVTSPTSNGAGVASNSRPPVNRDRLSRAKEWVANNSREASSQGLDDHRVAAAAGGGGGGGRARRDSDYDPMVLPGGFRPHYRTSMDSGNYILVSPTRGSYGDGYYDSQERVAMISQSHYHALQRNRASMDENGRYWDHQLDSYELDRYRHSHMAQEYEYDLSSSGAGGRGGGRGGHYGYPPGGPDDVDIEDEAESTLAPGSTTGNGAGSGANKAKRTQENSEKASKTPEGANRADGLDASTPTTAVDEEMSALDLPRPPNKKRFILRLISLGCSLLVLLFLIAAAPVSKSSSPFTSSAGLAFHYVITILSILVCVGFVAHYFRRKLQRKPKMKRFILIGIDILMTLAWLVDVFICISKFPCAVGGQDGW
ncbi:hypothetical protein BGW38_000116 [Lunasporangiospora selenospora]|uniref:Uncharacterized protein n=1 Tax=Lunasporangiospora selenospora TaxID=979761 RepID=A0A9P6FVB1_9FUNG|nr:hypothetical protein BGW38_000116 [Lunasporangiospora selenospora]